MGKWGLLLLVASCALAECPAHLFRFRDTARLAAMLKDPAPSQRAFSNHGAFLDYFVTPEGDEVMFGAFVRIEGRVLTLHQISILPLGASNFQSPVALTVEGVRKARNQVFAKAKLAGFAVVVLEADRVSGARKKNGGKSIPIRKVIFL